MNAAPASRRRPWRIGIGARLAGSFIAIVGLAMVACGVGWLTFRDISGSLAQFAEEQVPQLALATRLSRAGSEIGAAAAALAPAMNRSDYAVIRRRYVAALATLEKLGLEVAAERQGRFPLALSARARETLASIDIAAGKRFTLIEEMQSNLQQLRWLQTDILVETGPLQDDLRFNVETAVNQGRSSAALDEQRRSEALLSMVAQANLAIGVLSQIAGAANLQELQEANAFLGDSTDELAGHIEALEGWPDAITAQQLGRNLLAQANTQTGLPNRKRTELREAERLDQLVTVNNALVEELGGRIDREVAAIESRANAAAARTYDVIRAGQILMAVLAAIAAGMALVIGYFYVARNLLERLRSLAGDADALSAERADDANRPRGTDELDDLAHALDLFRKTQNELIQSAKLAALGQMAAGIGHELNQPLAAIKAHLYNAETLLRRGETDRATTSLGKVQGLIQRMSGQIAHMRRFARKPVAELASVNLGAALEEAVSLLAHRFENEETLLDLQIPHHAELAVEAELIRLEQVLVNLLSNALDAVQGRRERWVGVRIEKAGEKTILSVRDTGRGIRPEDAALIFDPFFTTKPPGSGLGLGLSISFNIMRDFGGTLQIVSSGEDGTEMRIILRTAA